MRVLFYSTLFVIILSILQPLECMEMNAATYTTIDSFIKSDTYKNKLPYGSVNFEKPYLIKDKNYNNFTFKKDVQYSIKDHIVVGNNIKKTVETTFNTETHTITLKTNHINFGNEATIEHIQITDLPIQPIQPQTLLQDQPVIVSFPSSSNSNAENSDLANGTINTQDKFESPLITRKCMISSLLATLQISAFFTDNQYVKKINTFLKITKFLDRVVPVLIKKIIWCQKNKNNSIKK